MVGHLALLRSIGARLVGRPGMGPQKGRKFGRPSILAHVFSLPFANRSIASPPVESRGFCGRVPARGPLCYETADYHWACVFSNC